MMADSVHRVELLPLWGKEVARTACRSRRKNKRWAKWSDTASRSWYLSDQDRFVAGSRAGQPQVADIHNLKVAHLEIRRPFHSFRAQFNFSWSHNHLHHDVPSPVLLHSAGCDSQSRFRVRECS